MYCPTCGTHHAATTTHCQQCGLDLRLIAQALQHGAQGAADSGAHRWTQQRHALGLLLVLCSLLVGCFIPICVGLFGGFAGLSSLITVLAGLAGVLLLLGSMLLLAAEGALLTSVAPPPAPGNADSATAQTGPTTPLLAEGMALPGARHDEPALPTAKR